MAKQRRALGFTLIELMIVVAIVGILAAFAYPSYKNSMYKSRRADGKSALMSLQQAQEKFRATCSSYATGTDPSTYTCAGGTYNLVLSSTTTTEGYYTLSIASGSATAYVLKATAVAGGKQAGDTGCTVLTLNQDGKHPGADGTLGNSDDDTACW